MSRLMKGFSPGGIWAVSSNAQGGKIALWLFHVLMLLTALMVFPKRAAAFSSAALAFRLEGIELFIHINSVCPDDSAHRQGETRRFRLQK
jgi:hypothetical protein